MIRRIVSILLVTALFYVVIGDHLLFVVKDRVIKGRVRQTIRMAPEEIDLTVIIVNQENKHEISWLDNGKEFRYRGEMYDVVKTEEFPGCTCYHCINDRKEKELIDNYNSSRHERQNIQALSRHRTININIPPPTFSLCSLEPESELVSGLVLFPADNMPDVPSPPPRII